MYQSMSAGKALAAAQSCAMHNVNNVTRQCVAACPPAANWTRVQGPNRYADAVDSGSVYQHGARRSWLRFLDATSDPRATNAAANNLRRAAWAQPRGALTAAFNAGQQMFDLVAVTSPNLGISTPTAYRVIGLDLDYDRGKRPTYTTRLTLGGP